MQLDEDPHEIPLRLPLLPDVPGAEVSGVAEIPRQLCPSQCINPPENEETNVPKQDCDDTHAIDVTEYCDGRDVGVWGAAVVVVTDFGLVVVVGPVPWVVEVEVVVEVCGGTLLDDVDCAGRLVEVGPATTCMW